MSFDQSGQVEGVEFGERRWKLAHGRELVLGHEARLMGILNMTPDSFSDGGMFGDSLDAAFSHARRLVDDGATIIDVGGESTRPDATPVSAEEEQRRILPLVERLAEHGIIVSVDTYRAETARRAIAAGAHIVNDVWGAQKETEIAAVAAETGAGLCLMHTGRERDKLVDPIEDQRHFLCRSIEIARRAGVAPGSIVLDPGFGFAKDVKENLELLQRAAELRSLGYPLLVGTSRKRFLRSLAGTEGQDIVTAASSVMLRERGAAIFRVHDVRANRQALVLADAVLASRDARS